MEIISFQVLIATKSNQLKNVALSKSCEGCVMLNMKVTEYGLIEFKLSSLSILIGEERDVYANFDKKRPRIKPKLCKVFEKIYLVHLLTSHLDTKC